MPDDVVGMAPFHAKGKSPRARHYAEDTTNFTGKSLHMKSSLKGWLCQCECPCSICGHWENLLAKVIIVRVCIGSDVVTATADTSERGLRLGSLGLLAALLSSLLLLQLLVAERRQGAGNLLDLVTGEILGQLLGELLQEEGVVGLLGVGSKNRDESVAQSLKLGLGLGVEHGEGREVDGVVGVLGIDHHGASGGENLAAVADANGTEKILGVLEIGLLLGAAKALALLGLGLVVVARLISFLELAGTLGHALSDALGLGLLVGSSLGLSLSLGLSSLLSLLALNLGVLGGVP